MTAPNRLALIQHRIDRQAAQLDFHAYGPLADFGAAHSLTDTQEVES